ncbi:MAG: GAF domain-containing protein [Sandaracinus sp.]|nr:GAF domain-containing protein [Sandaracinus sp.]
MSDEDQPREGGARASDVPMDLVKEREAFVRSFFKKGVEYTELLLRENRDLRDELEDLRAQNARLRSQVASDDAIRDLLRTVERLEGERRTLVDRSKELERFEAEHEHRQQQIEQEMNDLANLYVASFQLHASLSVRRVVRHLQDMVGQLVGAEAFVIYVIDDEASRIVPIASEHVDPAEVRTLELGEGPVGEACMTGLRRMRESQVHVADRSDPVAVIPLLADGKPIGAVEIVHLLEQKNGWASVDHELFELLAAHAGAALIAANLYEQAGGPLGALRHLTSKL